MAFILITGANRGIGRAMAHAYAHQGHHVIGTRRQSDGTGGGPVNGGVIDYLAADVLDEASLDELATQLGGRALDTLVLNAGVFIGRGGLDDPDLDRRAWEQVLMTNVFGPFATVRALAPALLRADAPKIAIISSAMGSSEAALSKGSAYAYRASKAAAVNLARNLAAELRPKGVAVGAYHPGWVRTDMGGPGADISVDESAEGLLRRIDALTLETTGVFEDFRGEPIAF